MGNPELEKSLAQTIEIIEYVPNDLVIKTILEKSTGHVSGMSLDIAEGLAEKVSPFDTFAQIIEGRAEIIIGRKSYFLLTGGSIIVPAHSPHHVKPDGRFKMILKDIKSGYE